MKRRPRGWRRVTRALRAGRGIVAVVDDAELPRWRAAADGAFAWTETLPAGAGPAREPFDLWLRAVERDGHDAALARRLRFGTPNDDPQSPLLSDPLAVDADIADWVARRFPRGGILALDGVPLASGDALRALATVARTLDDHPVALLLGTGGRGGAAWETARARLADEVGLLDLRAQGGSGCQVAPPSLNVAEAMRWCRLGAQDTGSVELIKAMAAADVCDGAAWLCLGSAMLRRDRNLALAQIAARRALALPGSPADAWRARRLLMLVLQKTGAEGEVARLGAEAEQDALGPGRHAPERPWLFLDAALGRRLDTDLDGHLRLLDQAVDARGPECRAIAFTWRAGARVFARRLDLALPDQRAAVDLFSTVPERSRRLLVSSRLGAVLLALGEVEEAAVRLEAAGREARDAGEFSLAAVVRSDAAAAWCELGHVPAARNALAAASRLDARVWQGDVGSLWRLRAEAALLLAEGRWADCAAAASELASRGRALEDAAADRFGAEGAYLLALVARARGNDASAARRLHEALRRTAALPLGEGRVLEALIRRRAPA